MPDKPVPSNHGEWTAMILKTFEQKAARELAARQVLRLQKILVPIDFSTASQNAFECALRLGEKFGGELTLLHVVAPTSLARCSEHTKTESCSGKCQAEKLRPLIAMAQDRIDEPIKWIIRAGTPSFEIVEAAKEIDADLIVIATHGYTGWKHFCIGSTAEHVVRAAPCPVFVVREKEHQFC
jgi:universal stress protein A